MLGRLLEEIVAAMVALTLSEEEFDDEYRKYSAR